MLILSMAGGGTRGILQAKFLQLLENEMKTSSFNLFDFFVGVSIGGMHACLIAMNEEFRAEELLDLYSQKTLNMIFPHSFFSKGIFSPKYRHSKKRDVMRTIFQDSILRNTKKPVMTYAYDYIHALPCFFSSYTKKESILQTPLADIADATSSAPTYFVPTFIHSQNAYFLDGGIISNNPATYALIEAKKQGYTLDQIKILSLGTGLEHQETLELGKKSENWGISQWFTKGAFIDKLFAATNTTVIHEAQKLLGRNFMHVPFMIPKDKYSLDDISSRTMQRLLDLAQKQFDEIAETVLEFIRIETDSDINRLKSTSQSADMLQNLTESRKDADTIVSE